MCLLGQTTALPLAAAPAGAATAPVASAHPDIQIGLGKDTVTVSVGAFAGHASPQLRLTVLDGAEVFSESSQPLAAEHRFPVRRLPSGDVGVVAAIFAGDRVVHSQFRSFRRYGKGFVGATSLAALDDAVLREDRRTGRVGEGEFWRRHTENHTIRGSVGTTAARAGAFASSSITLVSGITTYLDTENVQRPTRDAVVELLQFVAEFYQVRASTHTDAHGRFTLSAADLPAGRFRVRVSTQSSVGSVRVSPVEAYTVYSGDLLLEPGETRTGVVLDLDPSTETGRAFALLDAVNTVGAFYERYRKPGWVSSINAIYPNGINRSFASPSTRMIYISGGETRCGDEWCEEDAFDWDVTAHEVGHLVTFDAGIADPIGDDHSFCTSMWSTFGRPKQEGLRFAWSEGFATFFGVAALRSQGVPAAMRAAGDEVYDDLLGPPHNTGSILRQDLQTPTCKSLGAIIGGEDLESAVAGALWDFWDGGGEDDDAVSWAFSDILDRLDNANVVNFFEASNVLFAGRSRNDLIGAQAVLATWRFAPELVSPFNNSFSSAPLLFAWHPHGPAAHHNTQFVITIENAVTGAILATNATNTTQYVPSQAIWDQITTAGDVIVRLAGTQPDAPSTTYISSARLALGGLSTIPRLMVVGDSISQGQEADYTWRYRLKSHLTGSGRTVDFVGPYQGTIHTSTTGIANFDGGYGPTNFSFDSQHLSKWGWQAAQAKYLIADKVAEFRPDYLLVELGFNDIGWFVSSPDGLVEDIKTFVANARSAKPDIRILVANVVHRTPLGAVNPDLDAKITSYNLKIGPALQSVTTTQSPVRLVDISTGYDPYVDAYDGLHPNSVGEYKIARAFANVLSSQFQLGSTFGAVPTTPEVFRPAAPAWLNATANDAGIHVEWQHSYGASGYNFYSRNTTIGTGFERAPVATDDNDVGWVLAGHSYEYFVVPTRGMYLGDPSPTDSATADPKTAQGPTNLIVTPGSSRVDLAWTAPTGPYSATVYAYVVSYLDQSDPAAWMQVQRVSGPSAVVTGLTNGHTYIFAISSVNIAGDGFPSVAPRAKPGYGRPPTPTLQQVHITSPTDVHLSWAGVPAAADYEVRAYLGEPATYPVGAGTSADIGWLWPGAGYYSMCLVAVNGSLKSDESCLPSTLDTPTLQTARAMSRTDIHLAWTPVPGATGYRIMSRNVLNGPAFGVHGETANTTADIGWLFPGVGYYEWCIVALNGYVQSTTSNCLRTQLDAPVLTKAQILTATDVKLEWTATPGADTYLIYKRDAVSNPTGAFTYVGSTNQLTQQVGMLSPGSSRWEWQIVGTADGVQSPPSNIRRSHN